MYVCMCVYVYVCICVYVYMCMCACMCVRACVRVCLCVFMYACISFETALSLSVFQSALMEVFLNQWCYILLGPRTLFGSTY